MTNEEMLKEFQREKEEFLKRDEEVESSHQKLLALFPESEQKKIICHYKAEWRMEELFHYAKDEECYAPLGDFGLLPERQKDTLKLFLTEFRAPDEDTLYFALCASVAEDEETYCFFRKQYSLATFRLLGEAIEESLH
ncbi:hypothetical protein [Eubacterium oxidoreducens]|uniref:Uncharacterized protein n=1 Tax=Eubacterium oxidoreducens TaxID=1732 RepID=A0A1G6B3P2_EUBOX|nr:hypothetical protein [Eubacterium oxidoreducens]SDB15043.1 hypothetical protein SAMN02910417_01105 [Eubacterium oxidoreducens]